MEVRLDDLPSIEELRERMEDVVRRLHGTIDEFHLVTALSRAARDDQKSRKRNWLKLGNEEPPDHPIDESQTRPRA